MEQVRKMGVGVWWGEAEASGEQLLVNSEPQLNHEPCCLPMDSCTFVNLQRIPYMTENMSPLFISPGVQPAQG